MKNINFCHFIKSKGFNNERLAHAVGITPCMMSDRSTGRTQITLSEAVKAANALGVSIEEFAVHIPNVPAPKFTSSMELDMEGNNDKILEALSILSDAIKKR